MNELQAELETGEALNEPYTLEWSSDDIRTIDNMELDTLVLLMEREQDCIDYEVVL